MEDSKYTGREIAIFTDVHGLFEPLEAVLNDIRSRGITEIYNLGDSIGLGPESLLVLDMFEYFNVNSLLGNYEEYCILGTAPFKLYLDNDTLKVYEWLMSILDYNRLNFIKNFRHSIDLNVGGKNIALCHFANDVRCDFYINSYLNYLNKIHTGNAYKQFLYTNSLEQNEQINYNIDRFGYDNPKMRGYISALNDPLFNGRTIDNYDAVIQGHAHVNLYENSDSFEVYTLKPLGMGYDIGFEDMAYYVILRERTYNQGFDIEKVFVKFDRKNMEKSILNSSGPTSKIKKLVNMK